MWLEENKQTWWGWLDYWMSQDSSNWHPIAWAVDNNPIVIGMHLIAGTVLALSFLSILISFIRIIKNQGFVGKQHKLVTVFFGLFLGLMSVMFVVREATLFMPIYWIYASVKIITAVFAFLTAVTYMKFLPYLKSLPSVSEMNQLKTDKLKYERRAKLLNEHVNVWREDIGYHITLLKQQQKALADDLSSKGLPVTPIEDIHDTGEMTKAQALHSLEKIQSELTALVDSVNNRPDEK
jgi:hypothetical protein